MITTISTKSSGIEILLKRSIPDFTPADTIQAQQPRKSVWQSSGAQGEAMNRPYSEETVPIASAWNPLVSERQR